jgi:hypothetical protein
MNDYNKLTREAAEETQNRRSESEICALPVNLLRDIMAFPRKLATKPPFSFTRRRQQSEETAETGKDK